MSGRVDRVGEQDRLPWVSSTGWASRTVSPGRRRPGGRAGPSPLGVVDRAEAIREGRLHRVATVVCRDPAGRILVRRRPETVSRFPGPYNWPVGGAADAGESYQGAAARELTEEAGVRDPVRPVFGFLCRSAVGLYWIAVHEAVIGEAVTPDPAETVWHDRLPAATFREVLWQWPFVADSREAFTRYEAVLGRPPRTSF